jgi:hypothetical protein
MDLMADGHNSGSHGAGHMKHSISHTGQSELMADGHNQGISMVPAT